MPSNEESKKSRSVSVRLPVDVYEKAVAKAERDNRTLSNYILHLLTQGVADDCSCLEDVIIETVKKLAAQADPGSPRLSESVEDYGNEKNGGD
jgi:macrodomain Ter protein organizer (MatP/YcbG family)